MCAEYTMGAWRRGTQNNLGFHERLLTQGSVSTFDAPSILYMLLKKQDFLRFFCVFYLKDRIKKWQIFELTIRLSSFLVYLLTSPNPLHSAGRGRDTYV